MECAFVDQDLFFVPIVLGLQKVLLGFYRLGGGHMAQFPIYVRLLLKLSLRPSLLLSSWREPSNVAIISLGWMPPSDPSSVGCNNYCVVHAYRKSLHQRNKLVSQVHLHILCGIVASASVASVSRVGRDCGRRGGVQLFVVWEILNYTSCSHSFTFRHHCCS